MKVQKLAPWLGPELAIPTLKTRPENTRALRGSVGGLGVDLCPFAEGERIWDTYKKTPKGPDRKLRPRGGFREKCLSEWSLCCKVFKEPSWFKVCGLLPLLSGRG